MGLGLSALIGLKAGVLLWMFAYVRSLEWRVLSIPLLYASLVSMLVSVASHPSKNLPMLLGKSSDGCFPIWSIIMFSPYLYFVRLFSALRRLCSGEAPYSQVGEGLYVGGWPSSPDKLPPGNPAIIDCTCELPRSCWSDQSYLCVPTWDTRSPNPSQIESAVKWASRKRDRNRPVFVHCAYGHGRSVAVMCALLVALGVAEDWKSAEKLIRERRPYIRMNSLHRKALEEWSKLRLSPSKKSGELNAVRSDSGKKY
ncbi:hypothetical protein ACLB2K_073528 [Fragaria x ananassa]